MFYILGVDAAWTAHHPSGIFLLQQLPEQSYSLAFLKGYEDVLDSLVCTLSGWAYATGRATAYGDQDAAIWVPQW